MLQRLIRRRAAMVLAGLAVLAVACVTVNIYFPAAEVEKTAQEIVSDVYGSDQSTAPAGDSSSLTVWLAELLGPRAAHAQSATSVSNAAIRGLKQQIAANHQQLLPFYQRGNVGITNQGMLAVRDTGGLGVADVGKLRRLVVGDNQARTQLYSEVAKALNVESSQIPRIQSIFAEEWQSKAGGGWWVQAPNGQWRKK